MKFISTLAVALTVAIPVLAQDLSGLPSCAQQPTLAGIGGTGCALTDLKCICTAKSFISSLVAELPKVCSAADIAKTNAFAVQLCAGAGVTLAIPGSSPESGTGSSSASAAAPASTASSSASASAASSSSSASAAASTTSAAPTTSSSETANASGTESSATTASTGGAAHVRAGVMGCIAVGMGVVVGL